MEKLGKRIKWIDIAKGIGIILVIIGHCFDGKHFITILIYSFHMPLFFILSGLCFNAEKYVFTDLLNKKARELLVPLFVFTILIVFITKMLFNTSLELLLRGFPHALWFLLILFISQLVSYFCLKYLTSKKEILIQILFFALIGYLFKKYGFTFRYSLTSLFSAIAFFLAGYMFRNKVSSLCKLSNSNKILCFFLSFLLLLVIVYSFRVKVNMQANIISPIIVGYFSAFVGTFCVFMFSCIIENSIFSEKFIWLGQNTIIIMSVHLLYAIIFQFYFRNIIDNDVFYKLIQLLVVFMMSIMSVFVVEKKFKWILGKW